MVTELEEMASEAKVPEESRLKAGVAVDRMLKIKSGYSVLPI